MSEPSATHPSDTGPQINGEHPSLRQTCAELHARVEAFLVEELDDELLESVKEQTRISLGVIEEGLSKYSISNLSLSYNGGKDCLVLLVLFLSSLHTRLNPPNNVRHPHDSSFDSAASCPPTIPAIYCPYSHSFSEVEDFVTDSSAQYHLSLSRYATSPTFGIKAAFSAYLDANPAVKLIFVGTRRTDPHGAKLTHFDETDRGWPNFMRCHPVIDWRYREIWAFIRHLKVPYCPIYDQGYTSLGGQLDTHPNPVLLINSVAGSDPNSSDRPKAQFRPAYELIEDDEERLGRD